MSSLALARAVRQKTETKTANDFPKIFTFISPKKIDEVTQRCYWEQVTYQIQSIVFNRSSGRHILGISSV